MRFIVVALMLIPLAALAEPLRQTYREANGREIGRSTTDTRGNTVFRDAMGREVKVLQA